MSTRLCLIESASIVDSNDAGDGAYDLHGETGTPEEIGKAIADSLKTSDLYQGRALPSRIDAGDDLYLVLRIKFCNPEATTPGSIRPKRFSTPADPLGDVFFEVTGSETFRSRSTLPNMIDRQNIPKSNPVGEIVLGEPQPCNLPVPGPPLLPYVVKLPQSTTYVAHAVATNNEYASYDRLEAAYKMLGCAGYAILPASVVLKLQKTFEHLPLNAVVWYHEALWTELNKGKVHG